MTKHSFRILLSVLLVAALVFSFAPAAFAETETAAFDELLIGQWENYDSEDAGTFSSYLLEEISEIEFILPGGIITTYDEFCYANANGLDQLTASAENGKTDLGERFVEYLKTLVDAGVEVDDDYLEEAEKLSNIEVTYELFDFKADDVEWITLSDAMREIFDTYDNDGLKFHVTADYKPDPLSSKKVDLTVSFYRDAQDYIFFEPYFCGDWTDQNGNTWSFGMVMDDAGSCDLAFSMIAADGTEYTGESFYCDTVYSDDKELSVCVSFSFDSFDSPDYTVTEMTEDSITLTAEEGDLILTRS